MEQVVVAIHLWDCLLRDRPYSWDSVVSNSHGEPRIANSLESRSRSRGRKTKPYVQENRALRHRILTFLMLWAFDL